jgi:glucokinase
VIDGKLYRGACSMAGEIGHICIRMDGRKTREGRGGLETYVGNRRIAGYAVRALRAGHRSLIRDLVRGDLAAITPKIIAQAAVRRDPLALEIFDRVADCLAAAFASLTYILQPEVIIVGGGVARSGRILFAPLRRHLRERLSPYFAERIKVMPAELGERAGMIGCAALVFQNLR